jgi:uncharacterized protein
MRDAEFEWDDAKALENYNRHGVAFKFATAAFRDPLAIDLIDDRFRYGEERHIRIGVAKRVVVFVAYTLREERTRIISARRATKREKDEYRKQAR